MAFAAACAERLLPYYDQFNATTGFGDPRVVRSALDLAWSFIAGESRGDGLKAAQRTVEAATPDTEDWSSSLASRALDAASAVAQTLDVCLRPTPEAAVAAAEIAWEAAFGLDQDEGLPDGRVRIANRPFEARGPRIEQEERLQRESLQALSAGHLETQFRSFRARFATTTSARWPPLTADFSTDRRERQTDVPDARAVTDGFAPDRRPFD